MCWIHGSSTLSGLHLTQTSKRSFIVASSALKKKQKAHTEMRMTSHCAHRPMLFPKTPRTYGAALPTITPIPSDDPVRYTPIAKKLAGF